MGGWGEPRGKLVPMAERYIDADEMAVAAKQAEDNGMTPNRYPSFPGIRLPADPPTGRPDSGYSETREHADPDLLSYDDGDHANRRPWPRWQWCIVRQPYRLEPVNPDAAPGARDWAIRKIPEGVPKLISRRRSQRAAIRYAETMREDLHARGSVGAAHEIEVWGRDRWERLDPEQPASTIPVRPT